MEKFNYRNYNMRQRLNYPIQMVYQDPKVALNEFMRVRSQVEEAAGGIAEEETGRGRSTNVKRENWKCNQET